MFYYLKYKLIRKKLLNKNMFACQNVLCQNVRLILLIAREIYDQFEEVSPMKILFYYDWSPDFIKPKQKMM